MSTRPESIAMHDPQWRMTHIELENDETTKVIGRTADEDAMTASACPVNQRVDLVVGTDDGGCARNGVERIDMTSPAETVGEETWSFLNRLTGLEHDGRLKHRELA